MWVELMMGSPCEICIKSVFLWFNWVHNWHNLYLWKLNSLLTYRGQGWITLFYPHFRYLSVYPISCLLKCWLIKIIIIRDSGGFRKITLFWFNCVLILAEIAGTCIKSVDQQLSSHIIIMRFLSIRTLVVFTWIIFKIFTFSWVACGRNFLQSSLRILIAQLQWILLYFIPRRQTLIILFLSKILHQNIFDILEVLLTGILWHFPSRQSKQMTSSNLHLNVTPCLSIIKSVNLLEWLPYYTFLSFIHLLFRRSLHKLAPILYLIGQVLIWTTSSLVVVNTHIPWHGTFLIIIRNVLGLQWDHLLIIHHLG